MSIVSGFNPEEHRTEQTPGDYPDEPVIPKGYYPCVLIETIEDEEGGSWFMFKWQITAGPGKGQKVSVFDNPTHKDGGEKAKKASQIFRGRLANYCDVVGLGVLKDPSELLNRPVKVHFKPWVRSDGTSVNQVTHYKAINDASAKASTKAPFFPKGGKPSQSQVKAQSEWHQAAADSEDAAAATGGASDYDDDLPF